MAEREAARALRAEGATLLEIAMHLGVSKSSASIWVRDVEFEPRPRRSGRYGAQRRPNKLHDAKLAEIERLLEDGRTNVGQLSDRDFLIAGVALYAGEGAKRDGDVRFANSDPRMIAFFCVWLRRFFEVDDSRLRLRLYLHEGLDLDASNRFWSDLTGIPVSQFGKPYRAVPDLGIRHNKHQHGCPSVGHSCSRTHRAIMGLVGALLASECLPG